MKKCIVLLSMLVLSSCASTYSNTSIEHVLNNKERYSSLETIVHGFIAKDDNGNVVLSTSLTNKKDGVFLAIPKEIYEKLDIFYNKQVSIKAKYVEHDYEDDTGDFIPSHLLISNIELIK